MLHIALLITALLMTPISSAFAAAEASPGAETIGAAVDSTARLSPGAGTAIVPQDAGSVDFSMLLVLSLGILGLIWVRRHTAEL